MRPARLWWQDIERLNLRDDRGGDYSGLSMDRPNEGRPHSFKDRDKCDESDCWSNPCWVVTDDWCRQAPTGEGWTDGDGCTLPRGHTGPHAMFTTHQGELVDTDAKDGRRYHFMSVWQYDDDPTTVLDTTTIQGIQREATLMAYHQVLQLLREAGLNEASIANQAGAEAFRDAARLVTVLIENT